MKKYNVHLRKYFYPLCTEYQYFKPDKEIYIPNAQKVSKEILCLPIYGELLEEDIEKICYILIKIKED